MTITVVESNSGTYGRIYVQPFQGTLVSFRLGYSMSNYRLNEHANQNWKLEDILAELLGKAMKKVLLQSLPDRFFDIIWQMTITVVESNSDICGRIYVQPFQGTLVSFPLGYSMSNYRLNEHANQNWKLEDILAELLGKAMKKVLLQNDNFDDPQVPASC